MKFYETQSQQSEGQQPQSPYFGHFFGATDEGKFAGHFVFELHDSIDICPIVHATDEGGSVCTYRGKASSTW